MFHGEFSHTFWSFGLEFLGHETEVGESARDVPPRVDHLSVVWRLTPSMNGNQEFTKPRTGTVLVDLT
jgi:hypothetical protein